MVTFPLLCALRGLPDIEGFMLLSSAVGNVRCNMSHNHNGQRKGFSLIPELARRDVWEAQGRGAVLTVNGESVAVLHSHGTDVTVGMKGSPFVAV